MLFSKEHSFLDAVVVHTVILLLPSSRLRSPTGYLEASTGIHQKKLAFPLARCDLFVCNLATSVVGKCTAENNQQDAMLHPRLQVFINEQN